MADSKSKEEQERRKRERSSQSHGSPASTMDTQMPSQSAERPLYSPYQDPIHLPLFAGRGSGKKLVSDKSADASHLWFPPLPGAATSHSHQASVSPSPSSNPFESGSFSSTGPSTPISSGDSEASRLHNRISFSTSPNKGSMTFAPPAQHHSGTSFIPSNPPPLTEDMLKDSTLLHGILADVRSAYQPAGYLPQTEMDMESNIKQAMQGVAQLNIGGSSSTSSATDSLPQSHASPFYSGVSAFIPFQPRAGGPNMNCLNAIPVRRCPPLPDVTDPFPYLPPIMVRAIRPIEVGDSIMMLRDPFTQGAKIMQCTCGQWSCHYRIKCMCLKSTCVWPECVHQQNYPLFGFRAPIDSAEHC